MDIMSVELKLIIIIKTTVVHRRTIILIISMYTFHSCKIMVMQLALQPFPIITQPIMPPFGIYRSRRLPPKCHNG